MTQAVVGSGSRAASALLLWAVGSLWPVPLAAQDHRGSDGPQSGDRAGEAQATRDSSGSSSSGPGGSTGSSGSSAGGSSGGASSWQARAHAAAVDRATQVQIAPRLSGIEDLIRHGLIDQAGREARLALTVAEMAAGPGSRAAGDALEVLLEARAAQGSSSSRESQRLLERLVAIRNSDSWERPRQAREGVVVARPPKDDPVPPTTPQPQPPPAPSPDDGQLGHSPLPAQARNSILGVPPELCESILGRRVDSALRCMDAVVHGALDRGNLVLAESYLRQAASYRRGLRFGDDLALAENLFALGSIERRLMDYQEASVFLEEALALRERRLGARPLVATTLHELANVHFLAGRYADARPLYERALRIWEANGHKSRLDVVTALGSLGQLLLTTGDYAEARRLFERALAIAERERGRSPLLVARSLASYGGLLQFTGDVAGARLRYERALAILQKRLGPDDPEIAGLLINLGNLSLQMGDYARARVQIGRALSILQKAVPENSPLLVLPLLSLARLGRLTGEGDQSALLEWALRIQQSVLGPSHPVVASLLTDLAKARQADPRRSEEALGLASRALAIRRRTFGSEHPLFGESLANVGDQWLSRGRPQMAQPLYEEAAEVMEKALGSDHPALAYVLLRLALVRFHAEDQLGALEAALRTERISATHLSGTIGALPEDEALRYSATRISALDLALSLVSRGSEDTARAAVWDSVIRSRAAVLDEMATRKRGVGTSPQAVAASRELTQTTRHLAQLIVRATSEDDGFDQYQRLITEARTRRDKAERTLAGIVAPGRRGAVTRRVGLAETLAALPARSALVAFARYRQYSRDSEGSIQGSSALPMTPSYLAFVWSETSAGPRMVPVGSAQAVDALVESWRGEGARPLLNGGRGGDLSERSYRAAATNLRRLVWDPIEPHVRGAERVFLVPDGSLNLLNWAALPVAETGYLVDGDPTIHYLSAERDLIGFTAPRPAGRGLLAVGEPAFDEGRLFSAWISARGRTQKKRTDARGTQVAALRGGSPNCGPVGALHFEPLPASGREAAAVVDLWGRRPVEDGAGALRLTANEASEAAFKKMASGRRVLHLATHGFFLDPRCSGPSMPGQRGVGGLAGADLPETSSPDAPLRLAGLALAGANQRRWAGPKEEDGILTAEEIATLDLSGVEWAVLSACNTGVGTVRAGEGVLGLRRAFEVAGAGTLIMSLWPVEDEAAGQWMRGLYRARLEQGLATDEAVRSASREVLNERRRQGLDTHPHSWAGFVAAGDWR